MESNAGAEDAFLEVPASGNLIREAMANARQVYGPDALAFSLVKKWLDKNPFIIGVLRSTDGRYLGYFDILPLSAKYAGLTSSTGFNEREIPLDAILPPKAMRQAGALYLASIVVKGAGTEGGHANARRLFYGMARYLEVFYMPGNYQTLAIAVSADGKRVLRRLGSRLISRAKERSDGHDLYQFQVTSDLIDAIKARASIGTRPPKLVFGLNDK